jgi:aldose 1-epimerase
LTLLITERKQFGLTPEGTRVDLFTMRNDQGMEVSITNYGGAITSLRVPDRKGESGDVVLGYDTLSEYLQHPRFLGALIGRHANRLARGTFSLNGTTYHLAQNNGRNHLHGGIRGFDRVVWDVEEDLESEDAVIRLNYLSRDGEEGYPGNLSATVAYKLSDRNDLRIEYGATTDKDTIVNLTNHSYFNLSGGGNILKHELMINAEQFTPIGEDLIPTGELRDVKESPLDFTENTSIGSRINDPYDQLLCAGGYDHNFALRNASHPVRLAARAYEAESGRIMELFTTQPGLQFYSGNFLDGTITGKGGTVYHKYAGFCLETQHFPDAPNHPEFPSTILRPGEEYSQVAVFRFSTE